MKPRFKTYVLLLLAFFAASCVKEAETLRVAAGSEDRVTIELFTRLDAPFDMPVSRVSAIEGDVDKDPWILVFKDNGSGVREQAVFSEAVKTFVTPTNKSYVSLTAQPSTVKLWIMILANTEDRFFMKSDGIGGAGYEYSIDDFSRKLAGMSLADAAAQLSTKPLSDGSSIEEVPFLDKKLPMSYISPQSQFLAGINSATKIGSSATPLELTRTVAKIVIKNRAARFEMEGVVSVHGLSIQSQLHNLTGTLQAPAPALNYIPADTESDFLSRAADKGTDPDNTADPIYVYEYAAGSGQSFMIIKGVYTHADLGYRTYYYKVALVDDNEAYLSMRRNCVYEFTLNAVTGPGFSTFEDALASLPGNTSLDHTVTVVDENACEITANNEFYMGVSNRLCMIYNQGTADEYVAFTIMTNCTTQYPTGNSISLTNDDLLEITSPAIQSGDQHPRVSLAATPDVPVATTVKVRLKDTSAGSLTSPQRTVVNIKLGALEQRVEIQRWAVVPAAGGVLQYYRFVPAAGGEPEYWYYDYYLSTGRIESASSGYGMGFKLSTTENHVFRDDINDVTAEDGKINIHVGSTTQRRNALVWLTTVQNPKYPAGDTEYMPRRIKIYIYQSAQ